MSSHSANETEPCPMASHLKRCTTQKVQSINCIRTLSDGTSPQVRRNREPLRTGGSTNIPWMTKVATLCIAIAFSERRATLCMRETRNTNNGLRETGVQDSNFVARWNHQMLPRGKSYWRSAGRSLNQTISSSSRPMRRAADSHPGRVRESAGFDLVCTHSIHEIIWFSIQHCQVRPTI